MDHTQQGEASQRGLRAPILGEFFFGASGCSPVASWRSTNEGKLVFELKEEIEGCEPRVRDWIGAIYASGFVVAAKLEHCLFEILNDDTGNLLLAGDVPDFDHGDYRLLVREAPKVGTFFGECVDLAGNERVFLLLVYGNFSPLLLVSHCIFFVLSDYYSSALLLFPE